MKKGLSNKGFALPELLLAVAILAFALSGLLLLFINCAFLNEANRNLSIASSHTQFVMEDIREAASTGFSSLKANINAGNWDWNSTAINTHGLTALTNEAIDAQASGTEPLDVIVTVTWKDRSGKDRSIAIETLIGP
ncbi:MAG: type II secretion system protein [Candidatus Omnitrophica bacterium]|nr:type II secretion system protein [Candidatus Omnitrophota bacterium]